MMFSLTEVEEKVVSVIVGSLESGITGIGHVNTTTWVKSTANFVVNSVVRSNFNDQGSKMGLSQQELAKAGKIAAPSG